MKLITRNQLRRKVSQGFTLIELLLVLAILGILAAIVVPKMAGRSEDARKQAAVTQMSAFKTALNTFEVDNGYYPKGQNGLLDLIQRPRDAQNWHGPYLDTDTEGPVGPRLFLRMPRQAQREFVRHILRRSRWTGRKRRRHHQLDEVILQ